jgi:hypothetical protein
MRVGNLNEGDLRLLASRDVEHDHNARALTATPRFVNAVRILPKRNAVVEYNSQRLESNL